MTESSPRSLSEKDLAYERISGSWAQVVSRYDTDRRIEVLVDEFLGSERIRGKRCWDAGCGLGEFTRRIQAHQPASLLASDLAPSLVEKVVKAVPGVQGRVIDLLESQRGLQGDRFDTIVCSEVIEHTPDPRAAVRGLCEALQPGGYLALSVPNARWKWSLKIAETLKLREHYQGFENWVRPGDLIHWLREAGLSIERAEGVHLLPWHFLPKSGLRRADRIARAHSYPHAVNLAVLARKPL